MKTLIKLGLLATLVLLWLPAQAQSRLPAGLNSLERMRIEGMAGHVLQWETNSPNALWRRLDGGLIQQMGQPRPEGSLMLFEGMDDPRINPPGWEIDPRMIHPDLR